MATDPRTGFQVLSSADPDLRIRDYKRQRAHKKTRSGCIPCKIKKVKCDESKPICERCRRNRRPCDYGRSDDYTHDHSNLEYVSGSNLYPLNAVPYSCTSPKNGTSGVQLLHHFLTNWDDIFHIPGRDEIASLSQASSLIRNTILAIAACHLRHMSPALVKHRIAEHFYQSLAIRDFQRAIQTPGKLLGQQGVDAMLLAAMLLNMIAFTLSQHEDDTENDLRSSWVFSSREDRLGWLAMQAGLRPLVLSVSAYSENTLAFLDPVLFGHRRANFKAARKPHGLDIVPSNWIRVFKLKNDSHSCDSNTDADPNDALRPAVIALAYLRGIDNSPSNTFLNMMFLMKIHGDFRKLLYNRDERAVWLLGYWLGLMCRYEGIWWCEQRIRRDYRAVRMWLHALRLGDRVGDDGLCWKEMMQELEEAPDFTRYVDLSLGG